MPVPRDEKGAEVCRGVVERNGRGRDVDSLYVSDDATKTFCVIEAPSPEAIRKTIRKTAARNPLPVDQITQVRVLDPYFYR